MIAFLIKVPGQKPYHGIFPGQQQAAGTQHELSPIHIGQFLK